MAHAAPISDGREAKLFRNNRSQAVRIPVEFELPGTRVLIRKEGGRLIIEPEPKPDLIDVLRGLSPLKAGDDFPSPSDLDATLRPLRSIDL
ncbi:antitoxin [Sphingomonas sp. DT-51]|uniref:antitoxin n=1 Tax=Sphingomonas sp. DT-51 TaxID=3396165 RepID=UPI003F1E3DC0